MVMTGFNRQLHKDKVNGVGTEIPKKVEKPLIAPLKGTNKQRALVKEIVENPSQSLGKSMLAVGYSPNTAVHPAQITESKGFLEILNESGLTDKFLSDALHEDITNKKGNRATELSLGFKVRGRLKDDAQSNTFVPTTINIAIINDASQVGSVPAQGTTPTP